MHRVKKLKECLIGWCEKEVEEGMREADIDSLGKVVDMVKDLAETEEKCTEAIYYSTIMEAMEGAEDHAKRYGYDNWRYSTSGRFAPKGHGSYAGYPMNGNYGYGDGGNYGYSGSGGRGGSQNGSSSGGNSGGSSSSSGSYGYGNQGNGGTYRSSGSRSGRYGYRNDMMPMDEWSDKGLFYDEYKNARRHYHESGKKEDLAEMNKKMGENIANVIDQLREMSEDATPEIRKNLKIEMATLMEDIGKMM